MRIRNTSKLTSSAEMGRNHKKRPTTCGRRDNWVSIQTLKAGIVPVSYFLLKRSEVLDKNLFWTTTLKVGERFHLNITPHTHPKKKNINYQKPFRSDVWNPEKKKGVTSPHASPSWRGGPRWWCGKSTHASAKKNDSGRVDIAENGKISSGL